MKILLVLLTFWFQPTILQASFSSSISTYPVGKDVLYYGFFFDEIIASSIKSFTDMYFQSCLDQFPEFKSFMDSAVANTPNVTDIYKYYTKPLDPNEGIFDPFYHVTAKYCGDEDCSSYQAQVEPHINQNFEMQLVGYYFTNRTFGIRVKLTQDQEKLFDNARKTLFSPKQNSLPGIKLEEIPTDDFNPTNNKPHITLGTAPSISAVITGTDLMEIIEFEKDDSIPRTNTSIEIDVEGEFKGTTATIRHYFGGDEFGDAFVIYPSVKVLANAKFEPYMKPVISSASFSRKVSPFMILFMGIFVAFINLT